MTREQSHWLRYSNIVPIIFTAVLMLITLTGYFTSLNFKLDNISFQITEIKNEHLALRNELTQQKLNTQELQDTKADKNYSTYLSK